MNQVELISPKSTFADLFLPDHVNLHVAQILEDFEFQEVLRENRLTVRNRILLHGPPGCGKTSIAHALASSLRLKLYAVSAAATIDSFVGASEKNVEAIFKFAQTNPVVVLIDEFDSLAAERVSARTSADTSGNRTVNALLTNLEMREPLGIIVACTNMIDGIDAAVLRRFSVVAEIPQASREALAKVAEHILQDRFGITVDEVLREASTPSDVVRVATNMLRNAVITHEKLKRASKPTPKEMVAALNSKMEQVAKKRGRPRNQPAFNGI